MTQEGLERPGDLDTINEVGNEMQIALIELGGGGKDRNGRAAEWIANNARVFSLAFKNLRRKDPKLISKWRGTANESEERNAILEKMKSEMEEVRQELKSQLA